MMAPSLPPPAPPPALAPAPGLEPACGAGLVGASLTGTSARVWTSGAASARVWTSCLPMSLLLGAIPVHESAARRAALERGQQEPVLAALHPFGGLTYTSYALERSGCSH
mmetsp:Transcript_116122/g.369501  ORF Transcript_116122/g.369501 Transcript_116122/m.369501 type:complete len:110 (-) Transcript_116122:93-422(-)